jgi:phosphatidylinositol-3-phosphatase
MKIGHAVRVPRGLLAIAISAIVAACGSAAAPSVSPTAVVNGASALPTVAASPSFAQSPATSPAPATPPPATASPTSAGGLPVFNHVYLIVMENKAYRSIVGAVNAPYINSLIARYGLATSMGAESHPSEPNYIAMTSGGLQGVNSDGGYNLKVNNIFDQLDAAGRTWHVYAQSYPGGCYKSSSAPGVVDGPGETGEYARKHNPAISYTSISGNKTRCAQITHLASFDPAAADFEMIIPNLLNDMHSSSTRVGDDFLKVFVPKITSSPAFAGSLLIITWDEGVGADSTGPGGHIATILASPGMKPGSRFTAASSHYSLLRTIELAWGLPLLGSAAKASTITLPY